MISDSPYGAEESVLTLEQGVLAGVLAALLMLLAIALLHPLSGMSVRDLLTRIGETMVPRGVPLRSHSLMVASSILYATVGALLGLLYAASQARIPVRGLIVVGVFYGIVIWAVSRLVTFLLFRSSLGPALHSYPWFLACAVYGMVLAGCAAWIDRRRPRQQRPVPID